MKRILSIFAAMVVTVAMLVAMAMPAFAQTTVGPGAGNPDTNPTGKCAPGQNKDTSPGGLKKCP